MKQNQQNTNKNETLLTTKQINVNSFAVGDINSWRLGCIEENDHETAV